MKLIKKLSEMIEDEIEGAECYAKMALKYKEERPDFSRLMYALANEEMEHMNRLHKAVVEIIDEYRKEQGEPPAAMQAVYDYLHERHIDEAKDVKSMLATYRGE